MTFFVIASNLNENEIDYHTFLRPSKKMKMSEFKKKYLAKKNYQHLKLTLIISSLFAEIFRSLPLFEVEIIAFKEKKHQKLAYDNCT